MDRLMQSLIWMGLAILVDWPITLRTVAVLAEK